MSLSSLVKGATIGIATGNPLLGAASAFSDYENARNTRKANEANIALQREFAQKSIQWKTADAKAAGLHPLAALGAQTNTPTIPVQANPSGRIDIDYLNKIAQTATIDKIRAETDYIKQQAKQAQLALSKSPGTSTPKSEKIITPFGDMETSATTKQQEVEDNYGGAVGEVYGASRFLSDFNLFDAKTHGANLNKFHNMVISAQKNAIKRFKQGGFENIRHANSVLNQALNIIKRRWEKWKKSVKPPKHLHPSNLRK
jgi:hypothetical protein